MRLFDRDIWGEAFHSLRTNRKRSIATAFGIFWGILMLVILMSLSQGFSNGMRKQLGGISSNTTMLYCSTTSKPYKGFPTDRWWSLSVSDIANLQKRFPEIETIASIQQGSWNTPVSYGTKSTTAPLYSAWTSYDQIVYSTILAGRRLNESDEQQRRRNCTIGEEVSQKLFASHEEALGKVINIDGSYYTVVGVLKGKSKGMNINGSEEQKVRIPYTILSASLGQSNEVYHFLYSLHGDGKDSKAINDRIKAYIRSTHDIAPDDESAIGEFNISEFFTAQNSMMWGVNVFVWFIGIGTLLSGIIGISNIMLVSVKERTREIGIRRALGAQRKDIIRLILLESGMLSLLAGLVGLLLGVGIMSIVAQITASMESEMLVNPLIPFGTAIGALLFIIIGGVVGGLLPLKKALEIRSIEAIREE
ncbi:efflux ABC transporter, permease protein [Porphyromonas uenonis 60-3]|uniref:Efflux ABC transporter, permease protein n=1 Tax=Porphyromonas uenonis 60-3 TaxID=596327 RepID=C2M9Y8_9PORP|nr:ABC transporter permease [Porphyromonas uenonis]EEK17424.1 efflux ABC transporter, permease protein [Porphyromonas uenonis 60-3]